MSPKNSKSPLPVLVIAADAHLLSWLAQLFAAPIKSVPTWMEAIAEASDNKYQLILGGIAGTADQSSLAVGALRATDSTVKIILSCQPIQEPLARLALAAGADDYLIEPISRDEFVRALNGQLSSTTAPVPAKPPPPVKAAAQEAQPPPAAVDQNLQIVPDAFGLCGELLRAGRAPTEVLITRAEELLAQKLDAKWVQLQLIDQRPPANAPGKVQAEHSVALAHGQKLLLRLGPPMSNQLNSQTYSQILSQVAQVLAPLLDISQETAALQKLAVTDELTGLYNRRYVCEFTEQVLARAHEERFEVTVLLFDVDNFKSYNDTYGHATGDEVLRETADLMRRCSRGHDLVGRFGGDEFVMIFWDAEQRRQPDSRHPETAYSLSERFRSTVSAHDYKCLGPDAKGSLSISGGLASFPWDASTVDDLFARADDALLQAKASGKNLIYIVGRENHK